MVGRLGNRNSHAAPSRRLCPNQPQREECSLQTSGPDRDLQYRDGKRHQIRQTFRNKAIATITIHLHIRDQCAFEERTEVPEVSLLA